MDKSAKANLCHTLGDGDGGQFRATLESVFIDFRHTFRNSDGFQVCIGKRIAADISQALREGDGLDALYPIKRIAADTGHAFGDDEVSNFHIRCRIEFLGIGQWIGAAINGQAAPPGDVINDKLPVFQTGTSAKSITAGDTNFLKRLWQGEVRQVAALKEALEAYSGDTLRDDNACQFTLPLQGIAAHLRHRTFIDHRSLARRFVPVMGDEACGSYKVLYLFKPRQLLRGGIFKGCGLGHQSEE